MHSRIAFCIIACSLVGAFASCGRRPEPVHYDYTPPIGLVPDAVPDEMWLMSVDPNVPEEQIRTAYKEHRQVEYPVLGKLEIVRASDRKALLDALRDSIRLSDGMAAGCFEPRHILRMMVDGKRRDYVICFACGQVKIWEEGKYVDGAPIGPDQHGVFNKYLDDANIPIAP